MENCCWSATKIVILYMHLRSLSLVNFKNYEQAEISLTARINCFVGENGVGKTNILDAVHYLALCKSNLNPVDTQNIRYDQDFSVIQGVFSRDEKDENILCGLNRQKKKQFKRNKKEYKKLSEHIGLIPLVMVSPYDSVLINGGSEERRRFINGVIAQYSKDYLENLIRYNRALSQRNRLLKDFAAKGGFDASMLEVWDEQLERFGSPVVKERQRFVDELIPVFSVYYEKVSGNREQVSLDYRSQLLEKDFLEGLRQAREKDRALQYTTFGLHKDDLGMKLGDFNLKKVGSQGQQKTYLAALKLAESKFIRKHTGRTPILLLDDIFDKLDASRVKHLIALVSEEKFGQIFITDTSESRLAGILESVPADHRVFHIDHGAQIREKGEQDGT